MSATDSVQVTEPPLPPREDFMTLATPGVLLSLQPDSFRQVSIGDVHVELRDVGVHEASGGMVGMTVLRGTGEETGTVPWHYHHLGVQVAYVIRGWIELEFEGAGLLRAEAGDCFYQPARNRHRDVRMSGDFEGIEFTLPGRPDTTLYVPDESGGYTEVLIDENAEAK
ncbi:cupin domain-containing protein [Amycolatopsis jejuensis]|uniref:cupin domain-containing protein n=1 Tax=Amycolatopsis jejuensis TaxID=330084 RepID=UPI00068A52EE|nr:cupin domain-containing protein [Amycolatopsis jejuensis]